MDPLILTLGIVSALVLIGFLFLAGVSIKHAAKFRYLSARTIYLTLTFATTSTILILVVITSYTSLLLS